MATITFVGAGTNATAVNASVQPVVAAGTQAGDLVLVSASIRNSGAGVPVQPAGWATLITFGNMAIFGRIWQTGDVVPAVAFSGGVALADTLGQTATWRGVSAEVLATIVTSTTQLNGSSANVAYPGLTMPKDRHLLLFAAWMQSSFTATNIAPPTTLAIGSLATSTAGDDAGQFWRYAIQTTAANVTSGTVTMTGSVAAISRVAMLALKPAASIAVTTQGVYPPRVLVSVTDLTIGDGIALYRQVSGVRTLVQAGVSAAVTDPSFLRVDATLPFGVPVTYVAVVNGVEYATTATVYTLTGGKVAVTDAITGLAAEVVVWAWSEETFDRESTTYKVSGRNVVVSGDFAGGESDVELYTETTSSAENLRNVIANATQGIVQIRSPGGYDDVDGFYAVTVMARRRWAQDGSDQKRITRLHVVEVDGWASTYQAQGFTYGDLATEYTGLTYANLAADYATYLALSQANLL